jgi:glycosyltransferase involved in cell wall biosynthesis
MQEHQLVYAPHVIDNSRFVKKDKIDYRKKFNIAEDAIVFLFAGKFETIKNVPLLLKSFNSLGQANTHLILAGDGKLKNEMLLLISTFPDSVKNNIHFTGFVNQSKMPDLYAGADVFILSSFSETWGLSVNEAMASGKAIVVSNSCGCAPDLVKEGRNGYVFDFNKPDDLTVKLSHLTNKIKLAQMGQCSSEIISHYNLIDYVRIIEAEMIENNEE